MPTSAEVNVRDGLAPLPSEYDTIVIDDHNNPTTITYKKNSTTVATITLTYDGDQLTITRS